MPGWDGYPDDPDEDLDRHVDGYECEKCGYTPTQRELNLGTCPRCRPLKKKDENEQ